VTKYLRKPIYKEESYISAHVFKVQQLQNSPTCDKVAYQEANVLEQSCLPPGGQAGQRERELQGSKILFKDMPSMT
jgi:hypothetical protein